jgi:hypothetical protein
MISTNGGPYCRGSLLSFWGAKSEFLKLRPAAKSLRGSIRKIPSLVGQKKQVLIRVEARALRILHLMVMPIERTPL